jgi:hypothetical protein
MRVLHLMKCVAYFCAAVAYWLALCGYHGPMIYGLLCGSYLVLLAVDASKAGSD